MTYECRSRHRDAINFILYCIEFIENRIREISHKKKKKQTNLTSPKHIEVKKIIKIITNKINVIINR